MASSRSMCCSFSSRCWNNRICTKTKGTQLAGGYFSSYSDKTDMDVKQEFKRKTGLSAMHNGDDPAFTSVSVTKYNYFSLIFTADDNPGISF